MPVSLRRLLSSKLGGVLVCGGVLAVVASTAWAVIPDAAGMIHACVGREGQLRVIDVDAGQTCTRRETSLSWQDGAAAAPDSFVAKRGETDITDHGDVLADLMLPPGRYQVTAKLVVGNRFDTTGLRVGCALIPANEDGTPGDQSGPEADAAALHVAPAGQPGEVGNMTLFASQELSEQGSVVLSCGTDAGTVRPSGAFATYVTIRAVEVGEITDVPAPLPN